MLVVDARKTHLRPPAERNVFVALPPEQKVPGIFAMQSFCGLAYSLHVLEQEPDLFAVIWVLGRKLNISRILRISCCAEIRATNINK